MKDCKMLKRKIKQCLLEYNRHKLIVIESVQGITYVDTQMGMTQ